MPHYLPSNADISWLGKLWERFLFDFQQHQHVSSFFWKKNIIPNEEM